MKSSHNHYLSMTVILLLLSVISVRGCGDYDPDKTTKALVTLFEEGLVNNSDNLYALRKVYFNPSSKYSPTSVCLQVRVTVDNITCKNLQQTSVCYKAFDYDEISGIGWFFDSTYVLQLSNNESGTSQLSRLLSQLAITGVFYTFDPTFFTIMKALSSSLTLRLSFTPSVTTDECQKRDCTKEIFIHLREDLETMPCWGDAVDALSLVLVWVSCTNSLPWGVDQVSIN